jgi:acyl phosphate:glycerol-3-phosphate acyltransferase
MLLFFAVPLIGYLLGSCPFGYWLVKAFKGLDVRTRGSGNIGMTNVWRVAGPGWGVATLLLDVLKGVVAVQFARHAFPREQGQAALGGLAVLLGNVFSVFLGFKGGKGIGVSVGVFFSLLPVESSLGAAIFLLALLSSRMISVGSLLGISVMAFEALYREGWGWLSALALFAAAMVWWTHRQNILRILGGRENKVIFKKKDPGPKADGKGKRRH